MSDDLEEIMKKVAVEFLLDLEESIVDEITDKNLVYVGNMLKSVQVDVDNLELMVGMPYSAVVEFGSIKKFMPPIEPIERWVRLKLGVKDRKKARKIAWSIAMSFKKRGYKPHPFVRPAIDKVMKKFVP